MNFKEYLSSQIKKKGITRKQFIIELQVKFAAFEALDAITLTRWMNGTTNPSLYKQLLIASFFEKDLASFITQITSKKSQLSFNNVYQKLFNNIDKSYHRLSYLPLPQKQLTLSLLKLGKESHREQFGDFYRNMDKYRCVMQDMDKRGHEVTHTVFKLEYNKKIISHISFVVDITQFQPYLKTFVRAPSKKSILVNVTFFECRDYYELLLGLLCNHIIKHHPDVDELYIAVRGRDLLDLLEMMGGHLISSSSETPTIGNIHLVYFEFKRLISFPFVFNLVQEKYAQYALLEQSKKIELSLG